jgi:hypothetical protein
MSTPPPGGTIRPTRPISGTRPSSVNGDRHSVDSPLSRRRHASINLALTVGLAAIGFSAIYFISDVIEVAQGNFSTLRLSLTYVGEVAIPLFVIGLYAVQRPRIGRLGLFGAVAFAYSYVFFTSTVIYALTAGTPNWDALGKVFGAWMTVHGLIMLVGGLAFGLAVVQAGVLPRWTGMCLMAGVVLIVAMSGQSNVARAAAEAVTATAFIGMGVGLLTGRSKSPAQEDLAVATEPGTSVCHRSPILRGPGDPHPN